MYYFVKIPVWRGVLVQLKDHLFLWQVLPQNCSTVNKEISLQKTTFLKDKAGDKQGFSQSFISSK